MKHETFDGREVIAIAGYREAVAFPEIALVRSYWETLRNGRAAPLRADLNPRGFEAALEYALVLERIAPGHARIRLSGMHLNDLLGMEVRGMPLSALLEPTCRDRLAEPLEAVFSGPEIVEIGLSAAQGFARPGLSGRLLLLPLRSDAGAINRALGCFVTTGKIGRAPRRFAITSIRRRSYPVTVPHVAEKSMTLVPPAPGRETSGNETQRPKATIRKPQLRLVHSV